MSQDRLYQTPGKKQPFTFNEEVVQVFDDMLRRSIPFYEENLRTQLELAKFFFQENSVLYDLGCSHGNFSLGFIERLKPHIPQICAVDLSSSMLEKFKQRLNLLPYQTCIEILQQDIAQTPIHNASVVVLNYTLQFLPPEKRQKLLGRIYQGLLPGGVLLLSEKTRHQDSDLDHLEQERYYEFKRKNGYSHLEISQKREALEKVLISDSLEIHLDRLRKAGFQKIEITHKWFNFAGFLCLKKRVFVKPIGSIERMKQSRSGSPRPPQADSR